MQSPIKSTLLTIAGFDPTGGAGILVDAAVFRSLGFHPLAVLTSVAAQGSEGVRALEALPGEFIATELEVIQRVFQPKAIKVGMLYHPEAVEMVGEFLSRADVPVVFDPVMQASGGGRLITEEAFSELEQFVIPHCMLVTPNLHEAGTFAGELINDVVAMRKTAVNLSGKWECGVLIKGGHLHQKPVDVLAVGNEVRDFPHERVSAGFSVRGTGCALSSAVTAGLALGKPLEEAVAFGVGFTAGLIRDAYRCDREEKASFPGI